MNCDNDDTRYTYDRSVYNQKKKKKKKSYENLDRSRDFFVIRQDRIIYLEKCKNLQVRLITNVLRM